MADSQRPVHLRYDLDTFLIAALFFVVALVYASAGFGGGSTYLAILALWNIEHLTLRSTALICNLLVVGGSCWLFFRRGMLNPKVALPFAIASVPAALLGGMWPLGQRDFFLLLGVTLVIAGIAMLLQRELSEESAGPERGGIASKLAAGGGTGLLAGMVGIGGGIFLSPIAHLARWAAPHRIAGLTAFFILMNSAAGLAGQLFNSRFRFDAGLILPLAIAVLIGGQLGARLTSVRFRPLQLRRLTALVVIAAGANVLLRWW